ncbi:hypothetical protein D9M69_429220 [compost metagenome]
MLVTNFRAVVLAIGRTALLGTFPQALQVVELTGVGGHHVNDHVVHVQQHPVAVALAFFTQRLDTQGFDGLANLVQHRADLAVGGTGGDDHVVSDALLVANINHQHVLGLDIFKGGYGDLDQLVAFRRLGGEDLFRQRGTLECAFAFYFAFVVARHIKLVLLVCSGASIHVVATCLEALPFSSTHGRVRAHRCRPGPRRAPGNVPTYRWPAVDGSGWRIPRAVSARRMQSVRSAL